MTTIIRRAVPTDTATLAELGTTTFIETFGHLYPPEDLQAFLGYDPHNGACRPCSASRSLLAKPSVLPEANPPALRLGLAKLGLVAQLVRARA